jgi:hypothetical protein
MENPHRRGLAGALFAFGGAASRSTKTAVGIISQPEKWALYLVLFAGVITIIKKNATPDPWAYAMWFGIALGLAALLYEMTASRGIVRAYWEGRAGSMLWCGMIWLVAFGFSVNNWAGAATENQAEKTNLHKAAFTATADTRKALKDAEDTLARLKGKFDWSKSLDAPESYDARIEAAEADAKYESTRGGCKSKCIAKQQLAANLKAERANAIERATTAEEIKVAEREVAEAREVASNTKTEVSESRNDLVVLTRYAGMTEESAQIFSGLFSIMVVSILLSFGSMYAEVEHLRQTMARRPFGFWSRARNWYHRTMYGTEAPQPVYNVTVEGDGKGGEALDRAKALERRIMSAARNYAQPSHA